MSSYIPKCLVPPRRRKPGRSGLRHGAFGETAAEKREKKAREASEFERSARMAKRDLEYRDSPYAAPVTVEERDGRVIETRGQRCIAPRITHFGHV